MKTRDWLHGGKDLLFDDFEMMELLADGFQVALPRQARQEALDAAVELELVVELGGGGEEGSENECKLVKYKQIHGNEIIFLEMSKSADLAAPTTQLALLLVYLRMSSQFGFFGVSWCSNLQH